MKKYRFIWESDVAPIIRAVLTETLEDLGSGSIDREVSAMSGLVSSTCKLYRIETERVMLGFTIVDYSTMQVLQTVLRFPSVAALKEVSDQTSAQVVKLACAPL